MCIRDRLEQFEAEIKYRIEEMRPADLAIRKKLDIGYIIEKQNLFICEIRPAWKDLLKGDLGDDYNNYRKLPFAKAIYVKSKNIWKIYWHRASGKWDLYKPRPQVKKLSDFFDIVEDDDYGCFKG